MTYATKKELLAANFNTPDSWVTTERAREYEETPEKWSYVDGLVDDLLMDSGWKSNWSGDDDQGYESYKAERDQLIERMEEMIEDFLGAVEEAEGQAASERDAEDAWLKDAEYDPEHWAVGGDAYRN